MQADALNRLREQFTEFAAVQCTELPLYRAISEAVAADDGLIELLDVAKPGQARPVLLFAAVHDLVLRYPEEPLCRWYPSVGGTRPVGAEGSPDDPMPMMRRFIDEHRPELDASLASRSTQTNEPNRSCLWFAAVRHATADVPGRPIALIEVGASAGINLGFDRYSYRFTLPGGEPAAYGDSGVELACELQRPGTTPPLDDELAPIIARIGLDLDPVDLSIEADRRWLKACIWAEEADRHRRFDAAVADTLRSPPQLVRDDAVDGIGDLIEEQPEDAHIVVISSWVMSYLRRDRRAAFDAALDLAAQHRDVSWISAEAEGAVAFVPPSPVTPELHTVVGMARWRDGRRDDTLIARCHPHLAWMEWLA